MISERSLQRNKIHKTFPSSPLYLILYKPSVWMPCLLLSDLFCKHHYKPSVTWNLNIAWNFCFIQMVSNFTGNNMIKINGFNFLKQPFPKVWFYSVCVCFCYLYWQSHSLSSDQEHHHAIKCLLLSKWVGNFWQMLIAEGGFNNSAAGIIIDLVTDNLFDILYK